jgi:hypothetical protein
MTRITVDDSLSTQLGQVGQTVQLCNLSGVPLGHFFPLFRPRLEDNCPYSPEQLAEMWSDLQEQPLVDFWKEIGAK